jgi:hypothetical protein
MNTLTLLGRTVARVPWVAFPMSSRRSRRLGLGPCLGVLLGLAAACGGCGKEDSGPRVAANPGQAASQLDAAFGKAQPEFQGAARAAAEALRSGDYPAAVDSLQALKGSQSVTPEQGMAVHSSLVVLEGGLISAMEGGDAKARQAYQRLKALKAK